MELGGFGLIGGAVVALDGSGGALAIPAKAKVPRKKSVATQTPSKKRKTMATTPDREGSDVEEGVKQEIGSEQEG